MPVEIELQHPYIAVKTPYGLSYGGNQGWSDGNLRRCGCAVVAGLDLMLYLCRWHNVPEAPKLKALIDSDPIPEEDYIRALRYMTANYLPTIPRFGVNALVLAAGTNLFFVKNKLPYRARWGVTGRHLWRDIETMLRADIPVLLSVGQNFPKVWGKDKLRLYRTSPDGRFLPTAQTKAHMLTVTGIDSEWLQVSSWGRRCFIRRPEYESYIRLHSNTVVSNILHIR
jgi:hypothetical protein